MFAKTLKKKLMMQTAVLAAPLFLVGCSSVPDAMNPVEWYRSSVEVFSGDEPDEVTEKGEMVAEEAAKQAEMKKDLTPGFVAAPEGEYAQPVARQGEVVNALKDEPKTQEPPKAVAAPTAPVTSTEIATVQTQGGTAQPSAPASQPQASPSASAQPTLEVDNRSVGQVFADNISQTRPLQLNNTLRGTEMAPLGSHPFETVVVSSGGVSRQGAQYASLGSVTAETDVRETFSVAMAAEPKVVKQGRAHSLSRFNPSMFTGSFQVATIQFGNGSARLTTEDVRILREVISIHKQQGGVIRVVGHASSRTRDMAPEKHLRVNHSMSLNRADMVARELLKLGLPGENLFVGGVSDRQPLYQEVMPSGEAGNRRTEIFVDY